jgi:hypothetical protein
MGAMSGRVAHQSRERSVEPKAAERAAFVSNSVTVLVDDGGLGGDHVDRPETRGNDLGLNCYPSR